MSSTSRRVKSIPPELRRTRMDAERRRRQAAPSASILELRRLADAVGVSEIALATMIEQRGAAATLDELKRVSAGGKKNTPAGSQLLRAGGAVPTAEAAPSVAAAHAESELTSIPVPTEQVDAAFEQLVEGLYVKAVPSGLSIRPHVTTPSGPSEGGSRIRRRLMVADCFAYALASFTVVVADWLSVLPGDDTIVESTAALIVTLPVFLVGARLSGMYVARANERPAAEMLNFAKRRSLSQSLRNESCSNCFPAPLPAVTHDCLLGLSLFLLMAVERAPHDPCFVAFEQKDAYFGES